MTPVRLLHRRGIIIYHDFRDRSDNLMITVDSGSVKNTVRNGECCLLAGATTNSKVDFTHLKTAIPTHQKNLIQHSNSSDAPF
jgi:hypothetical protein